tara:strand:+ start:403 stop:657 length:255 start_codon:yes stop_codon:yes gene_type:complete
MSQPEEIREEEIPTDDEEEELTDDELAEFEEDEGDMITTEALLSSTLMTEDGDTVCSALVNIGRQLEMQNRIMVKMLSALQNRA